MKRETLQALLVGVAETELLPATLGAARRLGYRVVELEGGRVRIEKRRGTLATKHSSIVSTILFRLKQRPQGLDPAATAAGLYITPKALQRYMGRLRSLGHDVQLLDGRYYLLS